MSRAERINALLEKWRTQAAADSSAVSVRLLDLIGSNPFVTPRNAEEKLDVAYNTAVDGIRRLERRGILQQVGDSRRDRVFCAKGILDILEEPARLKPDS